MRIALLIWGARRGAFANLAQALAKGLRAAGVEEVLLVYLIEGPERDVGDGIRPISLGTSRVRSSIPSVARFLRRARPDVMISMPTLMNIPAVAASLLVARRNTKIVVYQADTLSSDFRIDHRFDLRMRALPMLARILYRHADALVAQTDSVLDLLRAERIDMRGKPVAVIPPPVDVEMVMKASLESPSHPWLVDKRGPVITSLGRLVNRKNVPLLIEAFAALRRTMDLRLIVFGEGPERRSLERLIDDFGVDGVSLAGSVKNPFAHIARSDVFVMASLDEAFCLALVEAMACGVPVVSTDAAGGGPRFVLDGGRYGSLVRARDVEALATAISELLYQPDLARKKGEIGRNRAKAFAPRVIANSWVRFLLEEIL